MVNHRAGLDDAQKIPGPTGTRTLTPLVVQPVASRYTDSLLLTNRIQLMSLENTCSDVRKNNRGFYCQ
jgi:hypothetical protein